MRIKPVHALPQSLASMQPARATQEEETPWKTPPGALDHTARLHQQL
jgi:hypothetical protein